MGRLTRTAEEWAWIRQMEREYHPCDCGVHICGQTPDGERPLTVLNVSAPTPSIARSVFEAMRAEAEAKNGEDDLLADLFTERDSYVDQFALSRQMLSRAEIAARQALAEADARAALAEGGGE